MFARSTAEDKFVIFSVDRYGPVHKFCIYFTIREYDGKKFKEIVYD